MRNLSNVRLLRTRIQLEKSESYGTNLKNAVSLSMIINMRNIYTTFQDRLLQKSFSVFFNRYVAFKKDHFTIFLQHLRFTPLSLNT